MLPHAKGGGDGASAIPHDFSLWRLKRQFLRCLDVKTAEDALERPPESPHTVSRSCRLPSGAMPNWP
jgi:hypothetical protein